MSMALVVLGGKARGEPLGVLIGDVGVVPGVIPMDPGVLADGVRLGGINRLVWY